MTFIPGRSSDSKDSRWRLALSGSVDAISPELTSRGGVPCRCIGVRSSNRCDFIVPLQVIAQETRAIGVPGGALSGTTLTPPISITRPV